MELEALFNAIIVKPIESQESTYGSIIVPDLGSEKNQTGKVGDVVVLPTQGFTKLPHNGNEYYVGPENQILAKINTPLGEVLAQTQVTKEEINHLTDLSNE